MISAEYFSRVKSEGEPLDSQEAYVLRVRGTSDSRGIWLGIDADDCAVAYFEVHSATSIRYSVSQVIRVQTVKVGDSTRGRDLAVLKVTCVDNRLRNVFGVFIDEVIERLSTEYAPVDVIKAAAVQWRSLLQVAQAGLSENAAAGLYGELSFLEEAVKAIGPEAVELWQRSVRDIHDFIGQSARVEVKTSSFQSRPTVEVHGLRQLEPPENARLFLAVLEVRKHGKDSLDRIVSRLIGLGVDPVGLVEKLSRSGYVQGMPYVSELHFDLVETRVWEILDETPVLNRSTLAPEIADAVADLRYSLALSALGKPLPEFNWTMLTSPELDR